MKIYIMTIDTVPFIQMLFYSVAILSKNTVIHDQYVNFNPKSLTWHYKLSTVLTCVVLLSVN